MRRFRFKLQSLLDYRRRLKEQWETATAAAVQALIQAERTLQQLNSTWQQSVEAFYRQQQQAVAAEVYDHYHQYLTKLKNEIAAQQVRVEQAHKHLEECRRKLQDATKDYKVVEKIKEHEWERYCQEMLAAEQKMLDEIGQQNYLRALS